MVLMNSRKELYTIHGPKTAFEMTWKEAEELMKETDIGVIILGSTEQHGIHNPNGADTLIPLEVAKRATSLLEKEGIKIFISTPIPFGMAHHHLRFPGSIALQPETAINLVYDLATCLIDQGINKLVLMIGHTSQEQTAVLSLAALKLQQKYGTMTSLYNWARSSREIPYPTDEYIRERDKLQSMSKSEFFSAHGGEGETAMMLAICPNLVLMDIAKPAPSEVGANRYKGQIVGRKGAYPGPKTGRFIPSPGPYDDFYKENNQSLGHIGDASVATKEYGEQYLKVCTLAFVELVKKLDKQN
jgi:creatinine amidohydrolase